MKKLLQTILVLSCTASFFTITGCATKTAETEKKPEGEYIWVDQGVGSRVRKKVYIGKKNESVSPVVSVKKEDATQMMNATRAPNPGS